MIPWSKGRKTDPPTPLDDIDDARELVEALADRMHGRLACGRHLTRFIFLLVRDDSKRISSEKDSLVSSMSQLAGCSADLLRADVGRVRDERDRQEDEEIESLEEITGMSGPDPFEGDQ